LPLPIRPDQRNGPSYRSFLEDRGLQTSNPLSSEKGDAHSSSMRAAAAAIHHLSVQLKDLRRDARQRARRAVSGRSYRANLIARFDPLSGPTVIATAGNSHSHWRAPHPSPRVSSACSAHGATFNLVANFLVDQFDVVELPGFVEVGFPRPIEAEVCEPSLSGDGFDPVLSLRRFRWAEIEVH